MWSGMKLWSRVGIGKKTRFGRVVVVVVVVVEVVVVVVIVVVVIHVARSTYLKI